MDARVITSIEGNKARMDATMQMKQGPSSVDEGSHTTELQLLDRGVVYSWTEPSRQYTERKLGDPARVTDSSRQIAGIASALKCQWTTAQIAKTTVGREVVGGAGAAHVRIDASRRCAPTVPAGTSCTLGVIYDQWSTKPNNMHAQLARYRRDYAAKANTVTGVDEGFMFFSQFGVPVDSMLLELVRKEVAAEGQAIKTIAVLRASRSCFASTDGASNAASVQSTPRAPSDPPSMIQYMGGMLLSAWLAEKDQQSPSKSADRAETLGTITTELKAIRAAKRPASEFELPKGFTRAF
jgi:hypothetical protein